MGLSRMQSVHDGRAVDPIPVTDQVARGLSPRECLGDLACDPFRARIGCDVDPDKVSALQSNDDEDIEQVEANGRNNEQVYSGDVGRVVTREGAPSLDGGPHRLTIPGQRHCAVAAAGPDQQNHIQHKGSGGIDDRYHLTTL